MESFAFNLPLIKPFGKLQFRSVEVWLEGGVMVEWAPFPGLHHNEDRYRHYLLSELSFFQEKHFPEPREVAFHGLVVPQERDFDRLEGFRIVKVKCARQPLVRDIDFFHFLSERLPCARFRVDANQGWTEEQFRQFARAIDLRRVDYFEEPTKRSWELATEYPIAFDELVLSFVQSGHWERLRTACALVVKPHLYDDIQQVLALQTWSVEAGIPLILSSLFNSSVGTQNLLRLATLCPEVTHGFDPFFYLERDTVENPLVAIGDCFPAGEVIKQLRLTR